MGERGSRTLAGSELHDCHFDRDREGGSNRDSCLLALT
jgi:hypothetical protein